MTKKAKEMYEKWAAMAKANAGAEWEKMSEEDRKVTVILYQHSAFKQYRVSRSEPLISSEEPELEDPQFVSHEPEGFLEWNFYYRDALVPEKILQKYEPGQFLRHEPLLYVSNVAGGFNASVRYLIASKNAVPLSVKDPQVARWRAYEIPANARFKVLDVIRTKLQSQVCLLHIPETYPETAGAKELDEERGVIEKAKQSFQWHCRIPLNMTMYENEWLERTKAPVGINDHWEFYPFDLPIS